MPSAPGRLHPVAPATRLSKSLYSPAYLRMLERLRAARQRAGLSQYDVAALLGRCQSFVSKVESGERRIDPIELAVLAQLYGKPVTHFLDDASSTGPPSPDGELSTEIDI
jgi:transcriptional regulator with XRE-family HTH domain